jgi:hypothetical protein
MGEEQPIAADTVQGRDSRKGRPLNRRVEIYVRGGDEKTIVVESVPPYVPENLKHH